MKILAINASPRIGGNTDILLGRILKGVRSLPAGRQDKAVVEKIQLAKLNVNFCKECDSVSLKDLCTTKDDMKIIFREIKEADVIIVGSPIFFGSITAQLKAMIDRFQCFWAAKNIYKKKLFNDKKKKIGVFVSCQGARNKSFFENAAAIIKNFFATIGVSYKYELFCYSVDKKGDILKCPDTLKKAFQLGERLVL